MSDRCLICGLAIGSDLVTVKKLGIQRLITASKQRNDGKDKYFYGKEELRFHKKCRLQYIESKTISALKRRSEASVAQPSEEEHFDFQNFCLFCNKLANEEFKQAQRKRPLQHRIIVSEIKRSSTQESILNAAILHIDDWSEQVKHRIQDVDLIEKKAVYHVHCYAKFCHSYRAVGAKRGRPKASSWHEARNQNVVAEKQRLVEAAAKIILEEVTSPVYKTDINPPPNDSLNDTEKDCPDSLLRLLRIIIMTNKSKDNESYEKKCVALAHDIVSAARPH